MRGVSEDRRATLLYYLIAPASGLLNASVMVVFLYDPLNIAGWFQSELLYGLTVLVLTPILVVVVGSYVDDRSGVRSRGNDFRLLAHTVVWPTLTIVLLFLVFFYIFLFAPNVADSLGETVAAGSFLGFIYGWLILFPVTMAVVSAEVFGAATGYTVVLVSERLLGRGTT